MSRFPAGRSPFLADCPWFQAGWSQFLTEQCLDFQHFKNCERKLFAALNIFLSCNIIRGERLQLEPLYSLLNWTNLIQSTIEPRQGGNSSGGMMGKKFGNGLICAKQSLQISLFAFPPILSLGTLFIFLMLAGWISISNLKVPLSSSRIYPTQAVIVKTDRYLSR